jgi:hypothetical protein
LVPWLIRETSNSEESVAEIPLSASADCTHEEAINKIEDLKGLPLNVEKWICMKDEGKKLKLLQRAQSIYTCRDKTEDIERVFNFGILMSLKSEFCRQESESADSRYSFLWKIITIIKLIHAIFSLLESVILSLLLLQNKLLINHKNLFLKNAYCRNFQ